MMDFTPKFTDFILTMTDLQLYKDPEEFTVLEKCAGKELKGKK